MSGRSSLRGHDRPARRNAPRPRSPTARSPLTSSRSRARNEDVVVERRGPGRGPTTAADRSTLDTPRWCIASVVGALDPSTWHACECERCYPACPARYSSAAFTRRLRGGVGEAELGEDRVDVTLDRALGDHGRSAISALLKPSATSARISCSRGVSVSNRESARLRCAVSSNSTIRGSTIEPPAATSRTRPRQVAAALEPLLEQVRAAVRAVLEELRRVERLGVAGSGPRRRCPDASSGARRRAGCPRPCASAACGCPSAGRRDRFRSTVIRSDARSLQVATTSMSSSSPSTRRIPSRAR